MPNARFTWILICLLVAGCAPGGATGTGTSPTSAATAASTAQSPLLAPTAIPVAQSTAGPTTIATQQPTAAVAMTPPGASSPTTVPSVASGSSATPPSTAPSTTPAATAASLTAAPTVLSVATPAGAQNGTPGASSTKTTDPTQFAAVNSAFTILMDKYYKPITSSDLLKAAWTGAVDQAKSARPTGSLATPAFTGIRETDIKLFQDRYQALLAGEPNIDATKVAFGAIQGMTSSLQDDHTAFLSPAVYARFQQSSTGGQSVGLGVELSGNKAPFVIQTVLPGGAAEKAGVKAGDVIVQVDGQDVTALDLQRLSAKLRGEQGTKIVLGLQRAGTVQNITITRAPFVSPVFRSRVLPNGIGYMRLDQFPQTYVKFGDGKTFSEQLDAALAEFEQAGVKAWVIDLRNNPGGSVAALAEMAGRFIPNGPVVVSIGRAKDRMETLVDGHLFGAQRPLAVLINHSSASSSELMAAAVQDYRRGVVVGETTAGAVNASEILPLPAASGIQVTVAAAFSGKGDKSLDGVGVSPDVTSSGGAGADDTQLAKAVSLLQEQVTKQPVLSLTPGPHPALSRDEIAAILGPVQPAESIIPAGPERHILGSQIVDTLNEFASGAENTTALKEKVTKRGWQGTIQQFYGSHDPPTYATEFDVYKDANGAKEAAVSNDTPKELQDIPAPIKLGDDTTAYRGINSSLGLFAIAWRHGRVTMSVTLYAEPGQGRVEDILPIARALDEEYLRHPIP